LKTIGKNYEEHSRTYRDVLEEITNIVIIIDNTYGIIPIKLESINIYYIYDEYCIFIHRTFRTYLRYYLE
jgi:hypothetical protein